MKTRVFAFVIVAILLMFCAVPAYGQGLPPLPHAFYGTVEINDGAAPTGTQIEARGEGVRTGIEGNSIKTTAVSVYGSSDPMGSKLVVQGDILDGAVITFYVNGVSTGQTAEWHSGEVTELNLTVTIAKPPSGGGGGAVPTDTIPPRISDVLLSNLTETSIDINWTTQELSDSQVEYWASPGNFTPLDAEMVIFHLVHITDLTSGTTYYYKTMSKDRAGNLSVSDEHTFTTLPGPPSAGVFICDTLSISPSEVNIGETVTISVMVTNTGDVGGSCEVTLKINDVIEATKEVTLDAGASREVTFTTVKNVAGSYLVEVKGLKGSFTVAEKAAPPIPSPPAPAPAPTPTPPTPAPAPVVNWAVIWGIIGGVIAVGLIIFLVARKRRT